MKKHIFFICMLLLLVILPLHSQNQEFYIEIDLNRKMNDNSFIGMPLTSGFTHVSFYAKLKDTSIVRIPEGVILFVFHAMDSLSFIYQGNDSLSLVGCFFLPPYQVCNYSSVFDPDEFKFVIHPYLFYSPVRKSNWILKKNSEILAQKYYEFKYQKTLINPGGMKDTNGWYYPLNNPYRDRQIEKYYTK